MNTMWRVGSTLILISMTVLAQAGGDPDEINAAELSSTRTAAQQSQNSGESSPVTSEPPIQTVSIRGKEYRLVPEAPLEPDDKRLDVYFSDKVGRLLYERSASVINVRSGRINAGFLFSEERDTVFSSSIMLDSDRDVLPGVRLSFGTRGYVALLGIENADVFGVALGVEANFIVPSDSLPLRLSASYYYAPDILAFGDADRIFDWNVNIGLKLRDSFTVYTGVRYLQMDTRPGTRKVDDKLHVGVQWSFG